MIQSFKKEATTMSITRNARLTLVAAAGFALTACAWDRDYGTGAPVLDSYFGAAVTHAKAIQTLNPDGVAAVDEGYSGRSALTAMENFEAASRHGGSRQSQSQSQSQQSGSSSSSGSSDKPAR
jgi:hypothetical protein